MCAARLLLLGAGGHGRVVADIAEANGWQDIAFLDRRWPDLRSNLAWPVIGTADDLRSLAGASALATIGDNRLRLEVHGSLVASGCLVPTLIHPSAVVSPHATIGRGAVIMPNAVVNAGARVGEAVIVNTGAVVEHDCSLGDGVHVSPGACLAGQVSVGVASWIGIGAVVREMVAIGRDTIIGAGSVAVSDIGDSHIAFGTPARIQSRKTQ